MYYSTIEMCCFFIFFLLSPLKTKIRHHQGHSSLLQTSNKSKASIDSIIHQWIISPVFLIGQRGDVHFAVGFLSLPKLTVLEKFAVGKILAKSAKRNPFLDVEYRWPFLHQKIDIWTFWTVKKLHGNPTKTIHLKNYPPKKGTWAKVSPVLFSTLAGGWTTPFETYCSSQIGSAPQVRVKIEDIWNHHLVQGWWS